MKLWRHKSSLIAIVAAAFFALVLLASLQYYWVGELSRAEQERMQANLRAGALRFSEDFDRELARAYLSFQMDATTLRDRAWDRYLPRYTHWNSTAPHPQLVSSVFLLTANEQGQFRIERLNPFSKQFEPSDWPDELLSLREQFLKAAATLMAQNELSADTLPDAVVPEVPALVIPLSRSWLLLDRQEYLLADVLFSNTILTSPRRGCLYCQPSSQAPLLFAHTIVVLNQSYIEQEFIPLLARRYFSGDDGLDYSLTIVDRADPQSIVYQSNALATGNPGAADATSNLMGIQFDKLNQLLLDDAFQLEDLSTDSPRGARVAIGVLGQQQTTPASEAVSEDGTGRWQLVLTHRTGSLEVKVDQARVRNLLISFSTILLLGVSMAILMVATQRAQRLAQQKIEVVAMISHELRTPLSVIRAAGENLADGVIKQPQQARRYGALIRDEGRRLSELVEQALELTSTHSGHKTYELRPIQVEWLIDEALSAYTTQSQADGFVVEQDIPSDLPPLLGDEEALVRVVLNILSNAMKYSGESRWVGVRACLVGTMRRPEIQIIVEDRGRGIHPDDIHRIFEPFYRGRDVVEEQIHGSGIGLSVVRQVVEAHGGRVSVESTLGKGSTFTLHLPAAFVDAQQLSVHGMALRDRLLDGLGHFLRRLRRFPT